MVELIRTLATPVALSVTVIVKLNVPPALGVPLITPVAEFKVRPVGKEPVVTAKVYGDCPPVAAKVAEYDTPILAAGRLVLVMLKADKMLTV